MAVAWKKNFALLFLFTFGFGLKGAAKQKAEEQGRSNLMMTAQLNSTYILKEGTLYKKMERKNKKKYKTKNIIIILNGLVQTEVLL